MTKLVEKWRKKWFDHRKKIEVDYDNEKREFEMVMERPFIIINVELPDGFEDLLSQFLSLEKDQKFHEELKHLIKKQLKLEKRQHKIEIKT